MKTKKQNKNIALECSNNVDSYIVCSHEQKRLNFLEIYEFVFTCLSCIGAIFLFLLFIIANAGYLLSTIGVNITQHSIDLLFYYLLRYLIVFLIAETILAALYGLLLLLDTVLDTLFF